MKSKRNLIAAISIIAILIIGAVVMASLVRNSSKDISVQPSVQEPTGVNSAEMPIATTTIVYTDDGFTPANYIVTVGDTIAVVNNSTREMELASNDHPSHLKEPELNLSLLQPGQSTSFTVTKVGTWGFHDNLKAELGGILEVNKKKS